MRDARLILILTTLAIDIIGSLKEIKAQDSLVLGELVRTEFNIPQSAAFDLLGVSPAQILTPANLKEFKVDWSFSNWRSTPNLAIQVQPIWEIFYNRTNLKKYRSATPIMRTLSTLELSAATILDFTGNRKLSYAGKINLYREKDPLVDKNLIKDIEQEYKINTLELRNSVNKISKIKNKIKNQDKIDSIYQQLDSLNSLLQEASQLQKEKIRLAAAAYQKKNWNSTNIECSVGQALSYRENSTDSIDLISKTISAWIAGCIGIGRKTLLTSMIRFTTAKTLESKNSNIFSGGINFRYGSHRFNYFTEFFVSDLNSSETTQLTRNGINTLSRYNSSIGGEWKITRNVVLAYGIRLNFDPDFKLIRIVPSAGISCLMGTFL